MKVASAAAATGRVLALDWLRGVAVVVMVECHVFNALLAPAARQTKWFGLLDWANGLVAPAFLFVSGAVAGLNLQRRWHDVVGFRPGWRRLWRRIGQILLLGYALHFPGQLLWRFRGPEAGRLLDLWARVDILQCIAASLALIVVVAPLLGRPVLHRWVCLALGIVAMACVAPVSLWAAHSRLPRWLLNYVWPTGVGLFPLVPWAAFPLLGVWLGPAIFSPATRPPQQSVRALLAAVVFCAAAGVLPQTGSYDARFVFARAAGVLVGLAGCCWLARPVRGTGWILRFGELSLWSYTVHLLMVYWLLQPVLGATVSPPAALLWLAAVLMVTAQVAGWRAKALQRRAAVRIMAAR
jgi:uncharacterized membrane protein